MRNDRIQKMNHKNKLINELKIKEFKMPNKKGKFSNKTFMFTGGFEKMSRSEAKSLVETNGGKVLGTISKNLNLFKEMSADEILDQRKNKFLKIGRNKGFIKNPENLSILDDKKNNIEQLFVKNKKNIYLVTALLFLTIFLGLFLL